LGPQLCSPFFSFPLNCATCLLLSFFALPVPPQVWRSCWLLDVSLFGSCTGPLLFFCDSVRHAVFFLVVTLFVPSPLLGFFPFLFFCVRPHREDKGMRLRGGCPPSFQETSFLGVFLDQMEFPPWRCGASSFLRWTFFFAILARFSPSFCQSFASDIDSTKIGDFPSSLSLHFFLMFFSAEGFAFDWRSGQGPAPD